MDKRLLIAFLISFLIIFTYPKYLKLISKSSSKTSTDSVVVATSNKEEELILETRKIKEEKINEEISTLQNKKLIVEFTNIGAAIKAVYLRDYLLENGNDKLLSLYNFSHDHASDLIGFLRIGVADGGFINDFKSITYRNIDSTLEDEIIYESPSILGLKILKKFSLEKDSYKINIKTVIKNLSNETRNINVEFCSALDYEIKNRYDKHMVNTTIKSYNKLTSTKLNKIIKDGFLFQDKVDWLALEDKYFTVIIKPEYDISQARVVAINDSTINSYIQSINFSLKPQESINKNSFLITGPKEHNILKKYNEGFEDIISRGFLGGLKVFLLIILNFFYKLCHNYGFSIIILTVLIKILLSPLTHKSFESMRKMQELQPQMKALQEKHKENPQQLNREVMELYKKHKANPFGGCLPILFQMPIFIALYQTLSRSVELRRANFIWWIKDLSEPDKMFPFPFNIPILGDSFNLLPLLMMGSMVWQQKLTPSASSKEQEKIMLIMPIVFGVMFYNLPSGLVLYWLVNNVLTIAHQLIMKKIK